MTYLDVKGTTVSAEGVAEALVAAGPRALADVLAHVAAKVSPAQAVLFAVTKLGKAAFAIREEVRSFPVDRKTGLMR